MSDVLRNMITSIKEDIRNCDNRIEHLKKQKAELVAQIKDMKDVAGIEVLDE